MQTLYQYRTYSVDSSEESGAEEEETKQVLYYKEIVT
jgi:hypothetical protein